MAYIPPSLSPQAPCHSRGGLGLPDYAHVHNTNELPPPYSPPPPGSMCPRPLTLNAYGPNQHCPPKRNQTKLKRDKKAPRCFPCQSPWQARAEAPRGGFRRRRRRRRGQQVKSLRSGTVTLLALVCPFAYSKSIAEPTDSKACPVQSHDGYDQMLLPISVKGEWGAKRTGINIPLDIKKAWNIVS